MTDAAATPGRSRGVRQVVGDYFKATEIDLRLFGMVVALAVIILGFGFVTDGRFLDPVNMLTLAVQGASVAILATGMVLVIVSRNIDLSVGSVVGVVGMVYAVLMHEIYPTTIGADTSYGWLLALAVGIALGAFIGAFQGYIIAYIGVPSFIVTLGGLLAFRGVVFYISGGSTQAPDDKQFVVLGGGPQGSIGGTASWIVGLVMVAAAIGLLYYNRRERRRFGFPLRPIWADALIGTVSSLVVLGAVYVANSYHWPAGLATQYAQAHGITEPPGGLQIESGIPWPVLIVIGVTVAMWFLATRRRFGRYVFAIGGNPDAAELGGINTRWTILKVYILMGILAAISAAIASARLNGATLDLGQGYELYVIAAAVIGGTSFAGGIGTIPGAVLGALVMYSLKYGLAYEGLNSPGQDIVAGAVLIIAVGADTINRRRGS
ncbi:MAG: sugar ABC transporter permease [Chloroflexi bacterium]|nr:sugar ABC transporter permease [Chloroflexota bacterium]